MTTATPTRRRSRLGDGVKSGEMFCGYGGASQGIAKAGAELSWAVNHSELAGECYGTNHPDVDVMIADLSDASNPKIIPRGKDKLAPGRYLDPETLPAMDFLWASPSCKFHSIANAKKIYQRGPQAALFDDGEEFNEEAYANSERSRVTMMCPLRYSAKHRPQIVVIENVVEAAKWGPDKNGSTFRWWLHEWEKLGYDHDILWLNSMFFPPCPQSRDRMYVVLWLRGNRRPDLDYRPRGVCTSDICGGRHVDAVQTWKERTAAWPLPKWGKYGTQYTYTCPDCRAPVSPLAWPAYSAIDWTNLGPTLAEKRERGETLSVSTVERIRRGLMKFRDGPPVLLPAKGVWGVERQVTEPMPTQTSQQERALVTEGMAGVVPIRTHGTPRGVEDQLPTATSGTVGQAFVIKQNGGVDEAGYRSKAVIDPLGALTAARVATPGVATVVDRAQAGSDPAYDANRSRSMLDPTQALTGQSQLGLAFEAAQAITAVAAGNTFERGDYTRARHVTDPTFTQHTTAALGFAAMPMHTSLRGTQDSHLSNAKDVLDGLGTVSAEGLHNGLISPALFQKINGQPGDTKWHPMGDPLNTVTGRDTHGLMVLPWLEQYQSDPAAITDQLATLLTHSRHALASIPVSTVPITDDELDQVHFRMLEPFYELRRAMAFHLSYVLLGNKTQATAGLGNAVTPPVADWITGQCIGSLDQAAA